MPQPRSRRRDYGIHHVYFRLPEGTSPISSWSLPRSMRTVSRQQTDAATPHTMNPMVKPWPSASTASDPARPARLSGGAEATASGPPSVEIWPATALTADGSWDSTNALPKELSARLRDTAPTTAGPRVKPRAIKRLVAALAIPARGNGTVLTAVAVTEETASANPTPTRAKGTISAGSVVSATGSRAIRKSPTAMVAKPIESSHRGGTRIRSRAVNGIISSAIALRGTKAIAVRTVL